MVWGHPLEVWKWELRWNKAVPKDLEHYESFWPKAFSVFKKELGLLVFTGQLKFGPPRDEFLKAGAS